jgi:hypothetical protein
MKIDHTEATFCPDCAIVIANGDTSGLADPDAHLARMDATLKGQAVIEGPDDLGFHPDTCDGCGEDTATDQWFAGLIFTQE